MILQLEDGTTETSMENAKKLVAQYNRPSYVRLRIHRERGNVLDHADVTEYEVITKWTGTSLLDKDWTFTGFGWGYTGTGPHGLLQFFEMIGLFDFDMRSIASWSQDHLDITLDASRFKPIAIPVNFEIFDEFLEKECKGCDRRMPEMHADACHNTLAGGSKNHEDTVICYGEYILNALGMCYYKMYKNWNGNSISSRIQEQFMARAYIMILELEKLRRLAGFKVVTGSQFNIHYAHLDVEPPLEPFIFVQPDINGVAAGEYYYLFDLGSNRYISVPEKGNEVQSRELPQKPLAILHKKSVGGDIMPDEATDLLSEFFG